VVTLPLQSNSGYDAGMNVSRFGSMGRRFRKTIVGVVLAVSLIAATPHAAMAGDDDAEHYDARVQGYDPDVELKSSGTSMAWIMIIFMGVVCVSVIFKDAKRSHLD
jgi:hypothetical protein